MKKHSVRYHLHRLPYYRRLLQMGWSYHLRKQALVSYPPYRLWIEPTNRCNLKCIMCPNDQFPEESLGNMDFSLFRKIIDEARYIVYDINLHHRGEPMLHPRLPEMIRYASSRGLSVKLHTNGTALTPQMAGKLLNSGLDLISFSFDGYEAAGYEQIRRGADFSRTLENIIMFLEMKQETRASKPKTVMEIIELDTVQTSASVKTRFIETLNRRGLNRLIVKQPHNWGGSVDLDTCDSRGYSPCTFPWHALVILWNGLAGPCPHDFFGKIVLGDSKRQTLKEIFNGPEMRQLRNRMIRGLDALQTPCRECDSVRRRQTCGIPAASFKYLKE